MPSVSIITTTYRHEQFITETIDSILAQSFTDWELLIGDDSPDDATWDRIQPYLQQYPAKIRAWHHNPNKGIVGNMNFLLQQVSDSSEYISFLEGDDVYVSDYLEKKLNIWRQYPNLGLVYNELSIIDGSAKILEKRFLGPRTHKWYKNETNTIGNLLTSDMVCFSYSTMMVKKFDGIQIRDLGYDGLMGSESDFWLQIAEKSSIYGIEEPLTLYRKHGHNTSKSLETSIRHFEYLVETYFDRRYINEGEYKKMQILISMMRSFHFLQVKKYRELSRSIMSCFRISTFDTITMGFQSVYYRMIKPYIFSLFVK